MPLKEKHDFDNLLCLNFYILYSLWCILLFHDFKALYFLYSYSLFLVYIFMEFIQKLKSIDLFISVRIASTKIYEFSYIEIIFIFRNIFFFLSKQRNLLIFLIFWVLKGIKLAQNDFNLHVISQFWQLDFQIDHQLHKFSYIFLNKYLYGRL